MFFPAYYFGKELKTLNTEHKTLKYSKPPYFYILNVMLSVINYFSRLSGLGQPFCNQLTA